MPPSTSNGSSDSASQEYASSTTTSNKSASTSNISIDQQQPQQNMSEFIDWPTFNQILEMDEDDEEREFSTGIVTNFFEQAESTFEQMDTALSDKNLLELSSLGHFLKGSSAALGLVKVKDSCEKIQHLGAGKDELGTQDVSDKDYLLDRIKSTLEIVRKDYLDYKEYLKSYFDTL